MEKQKAMGEERALKKGEKSMFDYIQMSKSRTQNAAYIQTIKIAPYLGARKKTAYRLILVDPDNMVYHISVYETKEEAAKALGAMNWDSVQ